MNIFQRMGNALSRFMYGRNGLDRLGLAMVWTVLAVDIAAMIVGRSHTLAYNILNAVSTVLFVALLYRMFSRNLEKRRSENARFMEKVWYPVTRRIHSKKQQRADKEHCYFTCPNCSAVCRVPKGKGRIVITCPRCGNEIHGKS